MESYETLVRELIEQEINEYITWNHGTERGDAMRDLDRNGFGDLFGNITGSRECSTYRAKKFLSESGAVWDDDIRDLFAEMGDDYFAETLARGAETLDVVICELVANHRVLGDMATAEGVDL